MKLCGHTMGTPKRNIFEAIELFSKIGYDGIEIRCAADGHVDPERITNPEIEKIKAAASAAGLEIACLTPYYKDYVAPEAREKSLAGMRRTIEVAEALGCGRVRSYGGITPPPGVSAREVWDKTVSAMKELGRFAADHGVTICIENHAGTLTMSAEDTTNFVKDVGLESVGILYDQAWVEVAGKETIEEAVRMMAPYIKHAHVKDWKFIGGDRQNRKACLMGEGDIDWPQTIRCLKEAGYDGFLSDEYEKHWVPELPDAAVGMKYNRDYVLKLIGG